MQILLVDGGGEWLFELPIDELTQEALSLQTLRRSDFEFRERLVSRLAAQLPRILFDSLDVGLQPPTEKQLEFAIAISRELGVAMPGEAFRYREAISEFISRHAELFKSRVSRHSQQPRTNPQ